MVNRPRGEKSSRQPNFRLISYGRKKLCVFIYFAIRNLFPQTDLVQISGEVSSKLQIHSFSILNVSLTVHHELTI